MRTPADVSLTGSSLIVHACTDNGALTAHHFHAARAHLLVIKQQSVVLWCFVNQETVMIKTWKVAILAALGAVSIASPALAQSAWTTGTAENRAKAGYETPYGNGFYAYAPGVVSRPSSGFGAFGMVPRAGRGGY
jgi:hypothetical protein